MKYDNGNMEEFFRKSLDKFNDEPSDDVWNQLDERLGEDKPKPFYFRWMKYLIPICLLLLCLSYGFIHQAKVLNDYKEKLSVVVKENQTLKADFDKLSYAQSQEIIEPEKIVETQIKYITRNILQNDTVYVYKYINRADQSNWSNNHGSMSNGNLFDRSGMAINQTGDLSRGTSFTNLDLNTKTAFSKPMMVPQMDPSIAQLFDGSRAEAFSSRMNFAKAKSQKKRAKKKIPNGPIIVTKQKPWGTPNYYYRAGFSLNVLNSMTGEKLSTSSLGFGYGFNQEIGLTTRLAINSGVMVNRQEYTIRSNESSFSEMEIQTYPEKESFSEIINRVEVENQLIEFPLGIKYDFYQDNRKRFFVNPTVKWSIYQPQEFYYFTTDARVNYVTSQKRFGYLNALNLAVGIEKHL